MRWPGARLDRREAKGAEQRGRNQSQRKTLTANRWLQNRVMNRPGGGGEIEPQRTPRHREGEAAAIEEAFDTNPRIDTNS